MYILIFKITHKSKDRKMVALIAKMFHTPYNLRETIKHQKFCI